MKPEHIERMRAACAKANEAATEIELLAEDLDDSDERHDARESARNIRYEADASLDWMSRISTEKKS